MRTVVLFMLGALGGGLVAVLAGAAFFGRMPSEHTVALFGGPGAVTGAVFALAAPRLSRTEAMFYALSAPFFGVLLSPFVHASYMRGGDSFFADLMSAWLMGFHWLFTSWYIAFPLCLVFGLTTWWLCVVVSRRLSATRRPPCT